MVYSHDTFKATILIGLLTLFFSIQNVYTATLLSHKTYPNLYESTPFRDITQIVYEFTFLTIPTSNVAFILTDANNQTIPLNLNPPLTTISYNFTIQLTDIYALTLPLTWNISSDGDTPTISAPLWYLPQPYTYNPTTVVSNYVDSNIFVTDTPACLAGIEFTTTGVMLPPSHVYTTPNSVEMYPVYVGGDTMTRTYVVAGVINGNITGYNIASMYGTIQLLPNDTFCSSPLTSDPFNETTLHISQLPFTPVVLTSMSYQNQLQNIQISTDVSYSYEDPNYFNQNSQLYFFKVPLPYLNSSDVRLLVGTYFNKGTTNNTLLGSKLVAGNVSLITSNPNDYAYKWFASLQKESVVPNNGYLVYVNCTLVNYVNVSYVSFSVGGMLLEKDREIFSNNYERFINVPSYTSGVFSAYVIGKDGSSELIGSITLVSNSSGSATLNSDYSRVGNVIQNVLKVNTSLSFGLVPTVKYTYQVINDIPNAASVYPVTQWKQSKFPYQFFGDMSTYEFRTTTQIRNDFRTNQLHMVHTYGGDTYFDQFTPLDSPYTDLENPTISITGKINYTAAIGSLYVTLNDQVGISEQSCYIELSSRRYYLNSKNRVSGDALNGQYIVTMEKWNPLLCGHFTVNCQDLRGHTFYIDKYNEQLLTRQFNLPYCTENGDPPKGVKRLLHIDSNYKSRSSLEFQVVFGGGLMNSTVGNVTLSYFYDQNNTLPFGVNFTTPLQLVASNDSFYQSFRTINGQAFTVQQTITLYIAVTYWENGVQKPMLSTGDIIFFTAPSDHQYNYYEDSQYKFRVYSSNWQPLPKVLNVTLEANTSFVIQLASIPTPQNLQLVTIHQYFVNSPMPIVYTIQSFNYSSSNITFIPSKLSNGCGNGFRLHLDSICDSNSNCNQYPTYAYYQYTLDFNSNCTSPNYTLDTINLRLSMNTSSVDVSSPRRGVRFTLNPTVNIQGSINYDFDFDTFKPIVYLTEVGSDDSLQCTTRYTGGWFNKLYCDINIPLNWGLRGVTVSVWGLYTTYGGFLGRQITSNPLTITSYSVVNQQPNIWSERLSLPYIYLEGSNFAYQTLDYQVNGVSQTVNYTSPTTAFILIQGIDLSPNVTSQYQLQVGPLYSRNLTLACPNQCSGNGICNEGICSCNGLYTGPDCSKYPYACPNSCSGNGVCQDSLCSCNADFMGPDCSIAIPVNTNFTVTVDVTKPVIQFGGFSESQDATQAEQLTAETKKTKFSIALIGILELDISGDTFATYNLSSSDMWTLAEQTADYMVFNASIQSASCVVSVKVYPFANGGSIDWQGSTIQMPPKSVKYFVYISGYTFGSGLNTMMLLWDSKVEAPKLCNDKSLEVGGKSTDLHWYSVPANQLNLYARYNDKILIDDREAVSTTKIRALDSRLVTVGTVVPYFNKFAHVDPDFSVMLNYKKSDQEGGDCAEPKKEDNLEGWFIGAIIIAGIIVAIAVIVGFALLYQKNQYFRTKIYRMKQKRNSISLKKTKK